MTKSKKTDIKIEKGSGNVFADLDLPGADELFARAQIGFHVFKILEERNLKQREIAALLRIPQPEVSHLMNGHSSRFTTDKLLDFLKRLNQTVTIQIRPHSPGEPYQKVRFATRSRTVGPPARIGKRKRTVPA